MEMDNQIKIKGSQKDSKTSDLLQTNFESLKKSQSGNYNSYGYVSKGSLTVDMDGINTDCRLIVGFILPGANRVGNVRVVFSWRLRSKDSIYYMEPKDRTVYDYVEKHKRKYHRPPHFSNRDVIDLFDDDISISLEKLIEDFKSGRVDLENGFNNPSLDIEMRMTSQNRVIQTFV